MINVDADEFVVAFSRTDLESNSNLFIVYEFFTIFREQFINMRFRDRLKARRAILTRPITKQYAIAEIDRTNESFANYVVVPKKHPSVNLEFWSIKWGNK